MKDWEAEGNLKLESPALESPKVETLNWAAARALTSNLRFRLLDFPMRDFPISNSLLIAISWDLQNFYLASYTFSTTAGTY